MCNDKSNPVDSLPLVLSVPELAKALRIGRNAAYDLVNHGQIRCIRIGKNIRIPQSALLEYLNRPI
jgi:excisionase family DNA binding protein